ncbi:MAG: hypothetical protein JJU12_04215 [Chlamydiales bacterium]|nr:hypothetical protein [Chlamydiales bacterium]
MSDFLLENNSIKSNSILSPAIQQFLNDQILKKEISRTLDTISTGEKEKECRQVKVGERPLLPPAGKSKDPNYLMILAKAFSKAFDSMSKGTIEQIDSYSKLVELNETMSQSVLFSTTNAIDKEEKEYKLEAQERKQAKTASDIQKAFFWVSVAVTVVMILGTVAAAVCTGGAAAALIPEEVSMFAGDAAEIGGELATEAPEMIEMDTFSDSSDLVDSSEDLTEENSATESLNPVESESNTQAENIQENQANKETSNELSKSNEENAKSEEAWKKRLKKVGQMVVQTIQAAPNLVNGIESLITYKMLKNVESAQEEVGNALSLMAANNSYFRFYQQLLQQSSSVAQEEVNSTEQVVETFSDITKAYQQISYGLASAV